MAVLAVMAMMAMMAMVSGPAVLVSASQASRTRGCTGSRHRGPDTRLGSDVVVFGRCRVRRGHAVLSFFGKLWCCHWWLGWCSVPLLVGRTQGLSNLRGGRLPGIVTSPSTTCEVPIRTASVPPPMMYFPGPSPKIGREKTDPEQPHAHELPLQPWQEGEGRGVGMA